MRPIFSQRGLSFVGTPVDCPETALIRFRKYCRLEPETGCVLWIGGQTKGRGHNVPYGAFWFARRRWFAHRWAAKYIHGIDIDAMQVDHCCPNIPLPNTLCVEHLQALNAIDNRLLQDQRKRNIHLQVGLLNYEDVYGPQVEDTEVRIPFYPAPSWLNIQGHTDDRNPF